MEQTKKKRINCLLSLLDGPSIGRWVVQGNKLAIQ